MCQTHAICKFSASVALYVLNRRNAGILSSARSGSYEVGRHRPPRGECKTWLVALGDERHGSQRWLLSVETAESNHRRWANALAGATMPKAETRKSAHVRSLYHEFVS